MPKKKRPNIFKRIGGGLRAFFSIPGRIHNYFSETPEEEKPFLETVQTVIEHPQETLPHIVALRGHLIRAVLYLLITASFSFAYITPILEFLARPLPGGLAALQAIDVTEPVGTVMRVSLLSGFALAFPLIALEVWGFFAPGLYGHERLYTLLAIPVATGFFILGMAFAYYYMLPVALPILIGFVAGMKTLVRPNSYFPFVVNMLFWLGIFSEFPLVVLILARLGIVKGRDLVNQWRLAIVIISLIAAIITPTTDIANMTLTMAPMIFLYFLSIILAFLAQRKREGAQSRR